MPTVPDLKNRRLGLCALAGFALISSAKAVFVGKVAQSLDPILIAFICFSIVGIIFAAAGNRIFIAKSKLLRALKPLLWLNATTLGSWVGLFVGVKYLEPSINSAIGFGVGPLVTLALLRAFNSHRKVSRPEILGAIGVLFSFGIFVFASFYGLSGVGWQNSTHITIGLLAAFTMGISIAGNTVFSKQLYESGFKEYEVLATRFVAIVLVCGGYVAATSIEFRSALPYLPGLGIASVVGIVLPLYLLQVAIRWTDPMEISLLLPFCPLLVMLMQQADGRLEFSGWSFFGLALFAFVSVSSILIKHRNKRKISTVAIVDAYSTANYLPHEFKRRGVKVVHIQSQTQIPAIYVESFRPGDFHHLITHETTEKTLSELRTIGTDEVIVGIESGVALADTLSEQLGSLTNGTTLSEARRNKFKMVETIAAAGLNHIPSILTQSLNEAIKWSEEKYPVVCKPKDSAGTDSVYICHNDQEVQRAFESIINTTNCLDLPNHSVLVQTFVEGPEFIVDLVACHGEYRLVAVERYHKLLRNNSMIYDTVRFLPSHDADSVVLENYTKKVARALQIKHGAIHAEVILSAQGPVLVEIAARQDGGEAHPFQKASIGTSQVEATVEALLEPKTFLKRGPYQLIQNTLRIDLISDVDGIFDGFIYETEIKALKSFLRFYPLITPGTRIVPTNSLTTVPAFIDLAHPDREVIEQDYAQIRKWEQLGMYRIKEASTEEPLFGSPSLLATSETAAKRMESTRET